MRNKRLHRTWYDTDKDSTSAEYEGTFSDPLPDPAKDNRTIVGVDWSEPGRVEVTYLIDADW